MALTIIGTLIGLAALVIQIIVWRTARTEQILFQILAEVQRLHREKP